ncbi:hypothetical protein Bca4012_035801 [Brassica carinata]
MIRQIWQQMANTNGGSGQQQQEQSLSGQNMNCNVNMGRNITDYGPLTETPSPSNRFRGIKGDACRALTLRRLNRLELAAGATTVPPEFQVYQLHPKQRSTLNQTNITTGITGTRPTDAETTSNDNIRGIGYSVIFQGPDLQRASIGAAEISSEFSHQPP